MENQELTPQYQKGFNTGYILREHKPELALSLSQTKFPTKDKDYGNGLKDGIKQRDLELVRGKEHIKEATKNKRLDRGR
ncbi:hypothetical protein C8N46_11374 [Kordia periserrulae]|uniref:Uncharacterized protein n=1 Tax=Kordia periserrulae TaxID=701523 RepID=A0A2T6BR80_9FLAO|nr:hypothetical protein [Kordia periserrulae]PTX58583.1 hypothetical protein C8N46_11374 [Kordia periserrulae]